MNPFLRLVRHAFRYRPRLIGAVVAMFVYASASAWLAYLIKPIFDSVLRTGGGLETVALMIVVAYLAKGIGSYASTYLMTSVGQLVVRDVQSQLFRHILGQSAGFFAQRTTGQLMSRISYDVGLVQQAVSQTLGDLLREALSLIGYAGVLFYYDARLALVCLTGAPILVYPLVRLGQAIRSTTRRSQEQVEALSHITAEAFAGHRIVKAFGAESREAERFDTASLRVFRTNMKVTSALAVLPPLMEFLGGLAIAGFLWYGSRAISQQALTTGEFTSFLAALLLMYEPIKKLSRVNATIQQAIAASQRVFELLETHTEVVDREGAADLRPLRQSIEYRDVTFAYDDGDRRAILDRISFRVAAGQMVAFVGLSGAGKTTLVNLIPRFYDPTAGAILVDGTDIRDVTVRSLRAQIGMVTQETVLFDDTIARNIAYGRPEASRDEVEAAARIAHADEFVRTLPDGYETRIGERGQRLSGGQRQRLAIARALLKNPPILILDEATSALDAESELLVQDALAALMQHRTTLVIAHRLSTVRRADAIIVLERGTVREIGRHDELLARPDGVYAKLYALQMFDTSTSNGGDDTPVGAWAGAESGESRA
ncbi:MAG: ABC transporter ATP-binding protein [Vicinamibacterales bacterium]